MQVGRFGNKRRGARPEFLSQRVMDSTVYAVYIYRNYSFSRSGWRPDPFRMWQASPSGSKVLAAYRSDTLQPQIPGVGIERHRHSGTHAIPPFRDSSVACQRETIHPTEREMKDNKKLADVSRPPYVKASLRLHYRLRPHRSIWTRLCRVDAKRLLS